jgi:hypothetical protein
VASFGVYITNNANADVAALGVGWTDVTSAFGGTAAGINNTRYTFKDEMPDRIAITVTDNATLATIETNIKQF